MLGVVAPVCRQPYFDVPNFTLGWILLEALRFQDEDHYENEIFLNTKEWVRANQPVILAGKCDSHRHSTTGFSDNVLVAKTSYEIVTNFII